MVAPLKYTLVRLAPMLPKHGSQDGITTSSLLRRGCRRGESDGGCTAPSQGRYANYRFGPRLQKVEPISHPQAFAFEIGRVGRSCVEEGPLKQGMVWSKCELPLRKWRRGWDSNPRYGSPYARFRGEYFQPLSHLSAVVGPASLANPRALVLREERAGLATKPTEDTEGRERRT